MRAEGAHHRHGPMLQLIWREAHHEPASSQRAMTARLSLPPCSGSTAQIHRRSACNLAIGGHETGQRLQIGNKVWVFLHTLFIG